MNVSNREELMELLYQAVESGAMKSVIDNELRDIRIHTIDGLELSIEWFKNLATIKSNSVHIWFDAVSISTCHPCFKVCLAFEYKGITTCQIGNLHNHLKEGYVP
ncbi:MAG: hypothetical protein [Bacteriophage sp.]|nr:MAG: hypothetical protein [Bacteriophage sp.]